MASKVYNDTGGKKEKWEHIDIYLLYVLQLLFNN